MHNYTGEYWKEIESKKEKDRKANYIYNWLNRDNLGEIVTDGKVFWIELVSGGTLPIFAHHDIKQFMKKKGFTYLYDVA